MPDNTQTITLGQLLGDKEVEEFETFDLTEVQRVLKTLGNEKGFDLAHSEYLQQRSLHGAELLIDMIAKLVKTTTFLESKINTVKNKAALEYKPAEGKVTADMRKQAGEAHPEVEKLSFLLAKAKGARTALERKYDILLKSHHQFKDLSATQRGSIISGTARIGNMGDGSIKSGATEWK